MAVELNVPSQLTVRLSIPFIRSIWKQDFGEKIEINFSKIRFAYPAGTIYFAFELKELIESRLYDINLTGIDIVRNGVHSYLAYVGFWQVLNVSLGNNSGEALASTRFIPITAITLSDFSSASNERQFKKAIENRSMQIAAVVTGDHRHYINKQLWYAFRETIRNVFEHAKTDNCLVFGQKWKDGFLEIAIADKGCGIASSLSSAYTFENESQGMKLAIQPGVSSKLSDCDDDDEWANAGFGLYVLSELSKRLGYFLLMSGSVALSVDENGVETTSIPPFKGTFIGIKLKQIAHKNFPHIIKEIVASGQATLSESQRIKMRRSKSTTLS